MLVLDSVTKQYGQHEPVIESMSHTFEPGTLTMLVGPNGAGKTTLLRMLSVLAYPTAGEVRYDDLNVHDSPYRYLQHVGVVHAEAGLPEHLTAVELLEWVARSRNTWSANGTDQVSGLLDRLRLDERRANLLGTYSSGMLKKVQIGAAFIARPKVLLMDEPLRSLDRATTDATIDMVEEFVSDGGIGIVASHLDSELRDLATEIVTMGEPE
ncbi:ABC transporter ATP-binding protein [Longibacter salinarum]|uniref:ABC transporter ATP-binding protein n=1 Tax=Longibacter salinarum TaxID=1850348 RepID=A0A2A8CUZ9_9BACT|nr:ABC transporter ATP-binding protein [Longibacter salinarum]PEN11371.1 ABC transporter ATP-binding protein [Longibacter salinarum]